MILIHAALLLLASSPQDVKRDVVFSKPVDGVELQMDIHTPTSGTKPYPAVLIVHGGYWMAGSRKNMEAEAKQFAKEGFVAVPVSYRFAPKYKMPQIVDDVQTAVRYLRANAKDLGIDPNRIGAYGHSAGAHLALLLGYTDTLNKTVTEWKDQSSRVNAVVSFAGPTDFKAFPEQQQRMLAPALIGKQIEQAAEDIKLFSPVTHVSKTCPPTFFLHGSGDITVPIGQSKDMEAKLRGVGVPVESFYIDGEPHMPNWAKPNWGDGLKKSIEFMKRYLPAKAAVKQAA